jgi:hypothetical protein
MVTAWIGFVTIGAIMARYFRKDFGGKKVCGVDIWFAVKNKSIYNNLERNNLKNILK